MVTPFDPAAQLRDSLTKATACSHPAITATTDPATAAELAALVEECPAIQQREHLRWLGRNDLFFLLVYLLNRKHFIRDERTARWTFQRCREVQGAPDGYADLWPRESFKSEIITFGLTIQNLLNDPERTFGFFSHTRPMASSFLMLIKRELEHNDSLQRLYPDVLWANPKLECLEASVTWANYAITVKRRGNPKEASIEAWGLTDGQPTGRRFSDITFDDVVPQDNTSALMIQQTTIALENSLLLTASDPPRYRYIGTYQEIGDTTQAVCDRGIFQMRKRGPLDEKGEVAYCSDEKFKAMRNRLSPKVFALQILLDPAKSKTEHDLGFQAEWLDYYDEMPPRRMLNVYGVVDPAGDTPDSNSQFALWIIGLGADRKRRILDIILDKLDLEERWQVLFEMQQKWDCLKWGYEKYAYQSDIEHYKYRMKEVNFHFTIVQLGGVRRTKDRRIGDDLIPPFKERGFIFPRKLIRRLKDGRLVDLVQYFKEREYLLWPFNPQQRDLLDALARIEDKQLGVVWPRRYGTAWQGGDGYSGSMGDDGTGAPGSWLSE